MLSHYYEILNGNIFLNLNSPVHGRSHPRNKRCLGVMFQADIYASSKMEEIR